MQSTITYGGVSIPNITTLSYPIQTKNTFQEFDNRIGGISGIQQLSSRKFIVGARFIVPISNPNPLIDLGDNQVDDGFATLCGSLYSIRESYDYNNTAQLILQNTWYYPATLDEIIPQETTFSFVDYNIQFTIPGGRRFSTTLTNINPIYVTTNAVFNLNFAALTEVPTPLTLAMLVVAGQTYTVFSNLGGEVLTIRPTITGNILINLEEKTLTRVTNNDMFQECTGLFPKVRFKLAFSLTVTNINGSTSQAQIRYRRAKL